MAKYTVHFNYHTCVEVTVEANSAQEALEAAHDEVCDAKYDMQILENLEEDNDPEVTNEDTGWTYSGNLSELDENE